MISAQVFDALPEQAVKIRKAVFMDEQGFKDEFDEIDSRAWHIVLYDGETPVATCRVFFDEKLGSYVLGRLAVMKEHRGRALGSQAVGEAERLAASKGGKSIWLHAQCRAAGFYAGLGYTAFGDTDYDEGCEHIWMKKELT